MFLRKYEEKSMTAFYYVLYTTTANRKADSRPSKHAYCIIIQAGSAFQDTLSVAIFMMIKIASILIGH